MSGPKKAESLTAAAGPHPSDEDARWRVPFGVGCWDFGIQMTAPFRMTLEEYVDDLRQRLELVRALNNLEVEASEIDLIGGIIDEDHLTEVRGNKVLTGYGLLWRVRFELYIPFRIQEEINGPGTPSGTKTEKFRVHMHYPYHSPVSFVELVDDDGAESPSTAMKLVREYLELELESLEQALVFDFVGPTPFHADLVLEGSTETDGTGSRFDSVRLKEEPGYAKIRVRHLGGCVPTDAVTEALFDEMEEELGLFYLIARQELEKWRRWRKIETLSGQVAKDLRSTGVWNRVKSIGAQSRDVAALYCDVVDFRSTEIQYDHSAQDAFRTFYYENEATHFRDFVETKLEGRWVYASAQVSDLLSFIEGRRSKSVEMTIVVVAAVTGALVGSLITLLSTIVGSG